MALKDKIEELIQVGYLRQLVHNQSRTGRRQRSPERRESRGDPKRRTEERTRTPCPIPSQPQGPNTRVRGVINTIAGGFVGGRPSASARRKHLRAVQSINVVSMPIRRRMPPITFTNADFKGIDPFQDDPMVITVEIENFSVMKTLVDQGSSVDVLYWSTFKKLCIPDSEIQPYEDQIVGFSGERVDTKGYIDLFTKFGEEGESK